MKTKKPNYKKGFYILLKYFDEVNDVSKEKANNELKELGLELY